MRATDHLLLKLHNNPLHLAFIIGFLIFFIISRIISICGTRQKPALDKKTRDDRITVTLFANEILLNSHDFSIIEDNLPSLLSISSKTKLYIIVKINEESEIDVILKNLEACGAFKHGLARHRVMFCNSDSGRISMVQQIQPYLHAEHGKNDVDSLAKRLPKLNITTFENIDEIINSK